MGITFLHAADLHLGSVLCGLQAEGPLRAAVRDATLDALTALVDLALAERVDLVLLAGDVFDRRDRPVRGRLHLRAQLQRLHEAGIRTFIVHGNHDPLLAGVPALALPASVTVFGPSWSEEVFEKDGRIACRVQGISYDRERVTADLSSHFRRVGPELTVGLLHANVGGAGEHAPYAPCGRADLDARGLDYWALGHVHTRAELPLPGGGLAVYPGNPQGRAPNEPGPRGCVLVSADGRRVRTTFVALDRVRWHRLVLAIDGTEAAEALWERWTRLLDQACEPGPIAHAVRLRLVGRGPLHLSLESGQGWGELEAQLRADGARRHPPVLLESLEVRTGPELDLEAISAQGGLPARLLEEAGALACSPSGAWELEDLRRLDERLCRLGLPPTALAAAAIVERAQDRAVALLVEEDAP